VELSSDFGDESSSGRLSPHPLQAASRPGDIVGAAIEVTPVDSERVTHCPPGERSFGVFYALIKGASHELRDELRVPQVPALCRYTARGGNGNAPALPGGGAAFGGTPTNAEIAEAVAAAKAGRRPQHADTDIALFEALQEGFQELGLSERERLDIWRVLAAILAVGDITFTTEHHAQQFAKLATPETAANAPILTAA